MMNLDPKLNDESESSQYLFNEPALAQILTHLQ